jgi:hypothetical protein
MGRMREVQSILELFFEVAIAIIQSFLTLCTDVRFRLLRPSVSSIILNRLIPPQPRLK